MGVRLFLELAVLFLLPALVVGAHALLTRGERSARSVVRSLPYGWLFAAGCVVMFGTMSVFAGRSGNSPDQPYYPAEFKDGKLVERKPVANPAPAPAPASVPPASLPPPAATPAPNPPAKAD